MATDQEIRDAGFKYIPQQQYLQNPFELPTTPEEEPVINQGIVNTNAFNYGGGGGGGGYYPGPAGDLVTGFQSTVNARQNRLDNPSNTFLGFNTMRNTPATEASTTLAQNIGIPQEQTMMGKVQSFLTPQSAQSILEDGYQEPRFKPGIIANLLPDRYGKLPRLDQAFIAQNMGYRGPTVFGENKGNQDPFGVNVRSGFGNYGEFVDKKAGQLTDTLTKQGGKIFDKYAVDPITGEVLDEEEFSYDATTGQYIGTNAAAIAKANQMNKLNLVKLGFYTNKKQERADLQKIEDDRIAKEAVTAAAKSRAESARQYDPAVHGATNYGLDSAGRQSYDTGQGFGSSSVDGGPVSNRTGRGRTGYFYGGLASIL